ncbi:zinc ABC transporter substrate-binding protein [Epibacterium ulvae]|uniref:zinc ABC transporter substrate-binding protein n=1 Tax=Epibacterium ulvae TaxID=1156985 RepID=UPI001BFC9AC4|nr:zinc ABC transporter substrate-binding protein [Epibacterium ulvae]MBT8156099.1 zinc ABC transporter substrate-binding protein [Epibacterium ulvae]
MKSSFCATLAALLSTTGLALADAPKVVTDISPVHGLVSRVMAGVGEPDLLVRPGSSPHGYSMRPSDARALSQANLIVWIGEALTPWLEHPIEELGSNAHALELLEVDGSVLYEFRTGATFDAHDHGDHDDHDDHADHDDHDDHADHEGHGDHADHEGHDDHADHDDHDNHAGHEGHDNHAGHDHDGVDPHAWLSPENGKAWLAVIAEELSEIDPDNAVTYQANAAAGQAEIDAVVASLRVDLEHVEDHPFVVFHDAYQYFERSFGLAAAGAISIGDASKPSAARIAEIQDTVRDLGVDCVFAEPQFNKGLVHTVAEAGDIKELEMDPLGLSIEIGSDFYVNLLQGMGDSLAACK